MSAADRTVVMSIQRNVSDTLTARDREDETAGREPLSGPDRRQYARTLIKTEVTRVFQEGLAAQGTQMSPDDEAELETAVFNRMFGLGKLQDYVDDDDLTDIYVNGHDTVWLIRKDGTKEQGTPVAASDQELIETIQTQARRGLSEKRWDFSNPVLDLQLPSGARLNAMAWVTERPAISIRRHNFEIHQLKQLVGPTMSESLAAFLRAAVKARRNIVVAGGTGAGKTTLLRCLINELDPHERLITVEDSLELALSRFGDAHLDLLETEAREANLEGVGEVDMAALVRNTLRMKPDRVIVGEIRGIEVLPMLLAMSQGNDGSLSTIHADSSAAVFSRLQMYMAMTPERFDVETTNLMVSNAIHLVVHIAQLPNQDRVITSVREIAGADGPVVVSNEIYAPDVTGRAMPAFPMSDALMGRLEHAGFDRDWLITSRAEWTHPAQRVA